MAKTRPMDSDYEATGYIGNVNLNSYESSKEAHILRFCSKFNEEDLKKCFLIEMNDYAADGSFSSTYILLLKKTYRPVGRKPHFPFATFESGGALRKTRQKDIKVRDMATGESIDPVEVSPHYNLLPKEWDE